MMVWLDTGAEQEGQAERELRPRADGAVLARHRQLHRGGHPRGGPGVHRLGDQDGNGQSSTTRPARRRREDRPRARRASGQGDDVVRICLEQTACPRFIVGKLYRFLVSETDAADRRADRPAGRAVPRERLRHRQAGRDDAAVEPVLLRRRRTGTRIKSPVDFALGIVRGLEGRIGTTAAGRRRWRSWGRTLFHPPSVKGWDGGPAWLNGQTLLFRQNLALALTSTEDDRFGRRCDPAALARRHGKKTDAELVDFFLRLFLQGDVPAETRTRLLDYLQQPRSKQKVPGRTGRRRTPPTTASRALCHLVLTLPEFQLD